LLHNACPFAMPRASLHAEQFSISDRVWCLARSLNPGTVSSPLASLMLVAHQCGTLPRAYTPLLRSLLLPEAFHPLTFSFVLPISRNQNDNNPTRQRPSRPCRKRAGKQVQSVLVCCSQCTAISSRPRLTCEHH
jgi:hypothetical protein